MRRRQRGAVPPVAVGGGGEGGDVATVVFKNEIDAEEPLLERGVQPRVEREVWARAVRVAGLVVLGGVTHDPAAARRVFKSNVVFRDLVGSVVDDFVVDDFVVDDFVERLAHERLPEPQFSQRPLPVRHARQDGEQQVPLHRARHVVVPPLVPEVR